MAININNIVDSLQSQINDVTDNTAPVEIIKLLKASKNVQEEFISIANINGIEGLADALALKLNVSDFETQFNQQFTAANILTLLKTVDGISSGLDADTLDGNTSDFFATATDLSSHESNTSNPHSVTKTQVGLSNVDNTSDINKPVSTATQTELDLKANQSTTYTKTEVDSKIVELAPMPDLSPYYTKTETDTAIANLVDTAPTTLNTLNELAAALGDDSNFSTTVTNSIATKAPLNSPTFTGTVSGITKTMVGLGNVDNTSDANKPVSTATQTALNLKSDTSIVSSHTSNTSNPHSVTKTQVGLSNVDNTSDASKPVSTATQTALDLKANLASPTFTGTISGITKSMVGLSNVDNTSDANKPVSTATQTALNLKANSATTIAGYGITDLNSSVQAIRATASQYGTAKMSLSGSTLTITTT